MNHLYIACIITAASHTRDQYGTRCPSTCLAAVCQAHRTNLGVAPKTAEKCRCCTLCRTPLPSAQLTLRSLFGSCMAPDLVGMPRMGAKRIRT